MIELGELRLANNVMNAAGPWASTSKQLGILHQTSAGAVVTKTFTLEERQGNPEPNQFYCDNFSLNCVGLKNKGLIYFQEAARNLGKEKPIIASVAEDNIYRLADLISLIGHNVFSAIELNLSCPNLAGKTPVAYRPKDMDEYIKIAVASTNLPVGVKLPPFQKHVQIFDAAITLSKYAVNHLVLSNTLPVMAEDYYHYPPIYKNDGMVGLGGRELKTISLKNVLGFRQELPEIPIIGVGGIYDKHDIEDYMNAGAQAVQIGTALQTAGVDLLNDLAA